MKTAKGKPPIDALMSRFRQGFGLCSLLLLLGCTSAVERDVQQGQRDAEKGYFTTALSHFDRAIKRDNTDPHSLVAAREGARVAIFELKDYSRSISYLRHLVLYSDVLEEREQAQLQLANIYFEHLQDYTAAITEIHRALTMNESPAARKRLSLRLARSYFYMAQFDQAESELNELLKGKLDPEMMFDVLVLRGHVMVSKRNYTKAIEAYKDIIKSYPERSRQENVGLQLAVCYEEDGRFRDAIEVLENMRGHYEPKEYIDLRIKRLTERMKNQPGAKGYRK